MRNLSALSVTLLLLFLSLLPATARVQHGPRRLHPHLRRSQAFGSVVSGEGVAAQLVPNNTALSSVFIVPSSDAGRLVQVRVPPYWSFSLGFSPRTFLPPPSTPTAPVFYSTSLANDTLPTWFTFDPTTLVLWGVAPGQNDTLQVRLCGAMGGGRDRPEAYCEAFALVVDGRPMVGEVRAGQVASSTSPTGVISSASSAVSASASSAPSSRAIPPLSAFTPSVSSTASSTLSTSSLVPTPLASSTVDGAPTSKKKRAVWVILGVLAGVALFAILVFLSYRRYRRRRASTPPSPRPTSPSSSATAVGDAEEKHERRSASLDSGISFDTTLPPSLGGRRRRSFAVPRALAGRLAQHIPRRSPARMPFSKEMISKPLPAEEGAWDISEENITSYLAEVVPRAAPYTQSPHVLPTITLAVLSPAPAYTRTVGEDVVQPSAHAQTTRDRSRTQTEASALLSSDGGHIAEAIIISQAQVSRLSAATFAHIRPSRSPSPVLPIRAAVSVGRRTTTLPFGTGASSDGTSTTYLACASEPSSIELARAPLGAHSPRFSSSSFSCDTPDGVSSSSFSFSLASPLPTAAGGASARRWRPAAVYPSSPPCSPSPPPSSLVRRSFTSTSSQASAFADALSPTPSSSSIYHCTPGAPFAISLPFNLSPSFPPTAGTQLGMSIDAKVLTEKGMVALPEWVWLDPGSGEVSGCAGEEDIGEWEVVLIDTASNHALAHLVLDVRPPPRTRAPKPRSAHPDAPSSRASSPSSSFYSSGPPSPAAGAQHGRPGSVDSFSAWFRQA